MASQGKEDAKTAGAADFLNSLITDLLYNPLNLILVIVCVVLVYKIIESRRRSNRPFRPAPRLEPMKKRDFTLEQLREFDGVDGRRVCVAVNGKVFDMTRGKRFYGPGGPYENFAGRDASRALATFDADKGAFKDEYDDLSDLKSEQMESIREWQLQFSEKYDYVGKLLRPGEEPSEYTDEEEEKSAAAATPADQQQGSNKSKDD